ncbi:MAG: pilus assembly protein PilM [Candidatus Magnetoovum sp. WYHC-5]|nr:pilus assembly protein PilM [Candidatus Magnetoovum sp. WYHC-5]
MLNFGAKSLIGLDIGSGYLKVAQLKDVKGKYMLELFDMLALQPSVISDEAIVEQEKLVEAIKELMKKSQIKIKDVAISLSGHSSVIIKKINLELNKSELDNMSEDDIIKSIRSSAEQYIPFGIEDVNIDYQILKPRNETGEVEALLVAVRKEMIDEYVNIVKESGLNPVIVDVDAFTLENMYEINYEIEEDSNIALIDIGANSTKLNLLKDGVSAFTRDSARGSKLQTDALMNTFQIPFETAEKLKRSEAVEGISPEQVETVIFDASEDIVNEINRSLEFFNEASGIDNLDELVIAGGGALVKGFPELLADRTGLNVSVVNPFKKIAISKKLDERFIKSVAAMAGVAVGLAIRRIGDR